MATERRTVRALYLTAFLFVACGPLEPEIEPPPLPSVVIGETPNGVDVLDPGHYLHLYPGLCVVLERDAEGIIRKCFNFCPDPCVPTDPRACRAFTIGSR